MIIKAAKVRILQKSFVYCSHSIFLGLAFSIVASVSSVEAELYRYTNDKGVKVIEDKIPPEFAASGYDILHNDGTLLRHVDRQLTKEEMILRNTEESRIRLRKEEEKRLQEWDASLLRRYSSIDDIKAAQARAMRDLNIRVSILKSNLNTIKTQIEREQEKAANIERRGQIVPEAVNKNIDILRLEIEDTEQSITMREEEANTMKANFLRDMERFNTLLDRVKMRKKQSISVSEAASQKPKY